ncbi:hypothetical protein [Autumnicola musiva]|uniref:Uncharacterized protein n=1 Tax=Autumnicola musiva TaxID=3075589 RepID=A0ABU3D4C3_9FLAO|nr:hypothetical protein [Zunongwangia sp. F117]MDT0676380.1 hypothetical protein [Zunongwangia sp. F117]
MMQQETPSGDAWEILSFLSGYGFWLIIALILVFVVFYKKFRE